MTATATASARAAGLVLEALRAAPTGLWALELVRATGVPQGELVPVVAELVARNRVRADGARLSLRGEER